MWAVLARQVYLGRRSALGPVKAVVTATVDISVIGITSMAKS
jgi:hypothetical protein